jgi:hypothetical protein
MSSDISIQKPCVFYCNDVHLDIAYTPNDLMLPCEWWGRRFLNHSNIEAVLIKRQPGDSPRTTKQTNKPYA